MFCSSAAPPVRTTEDKSHIPTELLKNSYSFLPKPPGASAARWGSWRGVVCIQASPDLMTDPLLLLDELPLFIAQHVGSFRAVFCQRPFEIASPV